MKNVLLIDSGSGGVNILKECVKVCPFCNYLLFCDDKNLPYGSKNKEQLQEITIQNLRNIKKFFQFEIVVLACNTLSCTCLERLREEFADTIFVGTVPAVKPAMEKFDAQDILVLATEATIKHNALIRKNPNLQTLALQTLASEIDAHLDELDILKEHLSQELNDFSKEKRKPKAVVLGCTHYLAVKDILQEILGDDVQFFDSANGVARRLKHFVVGDESIFFQPVEHFNLDNLDAKTDQIFAGKENYKNRTKSNFVSKDAKEFVPTYQVQITVSGNQNSLQSFWWWYEKE